MYMDSPCALAIVVNAHVCGITTYVFWYHSCGIVMVMHIADYMCIDFRSINWICFHTCHMLPAIPQLGV